MNKILIINGSPRGKNSNTSKLLAPFIEGALENNAVVNQIYVKDLKVKDCLGCFTCWGKTPGKCCIHDDMATILEQILASDWVIWASPLYHYGITAALKRVLERTPPLDLPQIEQSPEGCYHPSRFPGKQRSDLWVLNCGFPDMVHFSAVEEQMKLLYKNSGKNAQSLFCSAGEFLKHEHAKPLFEKYLSVVKECGACAALHSKIPEDLLAETKKPFIGIEKYCDLVNHHWQETNINH